MSMPTGRVECVHLADGRLVRLAGMTGSDQVTGLRAAFFAPLARGCRDVVVDAGDVTGVTDEALATLAAAVGFIAEQGGRFLLSRSSAELDGRMAAVGVVLPRLAPLPMARRTSPMLRSPRCFAPPVRDLRRRRGHRSPRVSPR